MTIKQQRISATSSPQAVGGYSQALAVEGAERLLFVSGQIPETASGETPDDFPSQCRLVWDHVLAQLEAAGMMAQNLVKVTIFLSSREFAEENSQLRREALGDHRPALTVIITGIFDQKWLLEIEAIAAA